MDDKYYPWGGEYTICSPEGCTAVVLLTTDYIPPDIVAIYGSLRTENIGIEKIVANIISNPKIRYLILCGDDIRGHRSGSSLIALHKNSIDSQNRIIEAEGAIPYIENLNKKAIDTFQKQVEIFNLMNIKDKEKIDNLIYKLDKESPGSFGEPYIAIRIKVQHKITVNDKRALHSKILLNYLGKVEKRGK